MGRLRSAISGEKSRALRLGMRSGICSLELASTPDALVARVLSWRSGAARRGHCALRVALGRDVPPRGYHRRILVSRILAIHAVERNWLLAGRDPALCRIRRHPPA